MSNYTEAPNIQPENETRLTVANYGFTEAKAHQLNRCTSHKD